MSVSRLTRLRLTFAVMLLVASIPTAALADPPETSCTACHANPEWFEPEERAIVTDYLTSDVHASVDLSCHDCHGGNPDTALSEDLDAMDPDDADNPFRGAPARTDIPGFCGRCHSDPTFMRQYDPAARVDQEEEYWTSRHGERLRQGDEGVATCIDCHGVHGILALDDVDAPVYPTHVAETCNHCHGDPDHMAGRTLPSGEPLPVDQYARWRQSVHAAALLEREDLSAPTCNDCHGNHGATPPGVESIAFVCGQCHGREAELFRASAKLEGFRDHNEMLEDAGDEGCASCHTPPEPAAQLTGVHSLTECTTCHHNHAIVRPTLAMLAPLPELPCTFCHEGEEPVAGALAERESVQRHYREVRDGLLATAEQEGITDPVARHDWLVDQALHLPFHTQPDQGDGGEPALQPEFQRLFEKFRIGRTYFTFVDPASGEEVRDDIVRCSNCHAQLEDSTPPGGLQTSAEMLARMRQLTSLTARAERMMLAARAGGVEVRQVQAQIDQAVDAQIELEVLVHGFSVQEGSDFDSKGTEGIGYAQTALQSAHDALDNLAFRRRGLFISLGLIALVLIGLGLKIRQLSRQKVTADGAGADANH